MTKFKEYLRAKGIKLECDYEFLPCNYIESVATRVMDDGVVAIVYSNCAGAEYAVFNRYGECNYYDGDDYHAYVSGPICDPEYIDFLYDTGCNKSFDVFEAMEQLYLDDAKTRIAFKHMKAGIMDYMVFYKWISDRYQAYINS